ncbi:MAG: RHS repeat-associated core domain-containing protein [Cytophagales bacterium]|nr:MAG: RHS repeat-associated core domain-containing protein [Cytophagales bacterium]
MANHKNDNKLLGNFCVYDIHIEEELYKYGKADMDRVTQSSNLPTRLHQQVRKLQNDNEEVEGRVLVELPNVTTEYAKDVENELIAEYLAIHGELPKGNKRLNKKKQR